MSTPPSLLFLNISVWQTPIDSIKIDKIKLNNHPLPVLPKLPTISKSTSLSNIIHELHDVIQTRPVGEHHSFLHVNFKSIFISIVILILFVIAVVIVILIRRKLPLLFRFGRKSKPATIVSESEDVSPPANNDTFVDTKQVGQQTLYPSLPLLPINKES